MKTKIKKTKPSLFQKLCEGEQKPKRNWKEIIDRFLLKKEHNIE